MRRFVNLGRHAQLACRRSSFPGELGDLESAVVTQLNNAPCTCLLTQQCAIHGSAHPSANPDNKPPPNGGDKNDPTNVKYDTPTRDPDDTSDYAPGYYDEKGKGGHRRVASQEESKQVPDNVVGGVPKGYNPEEADDPHKPKPKDPNAADIPKMTPRGSKDQAAGSADSARGPVDPNQDPPVGTSKGRMPDAESDLAGMPTPGAPPASTSTSGAPADQQAGSTDSYSDPFGDPASLDDVAKPGQQVLDEGLVKEGAPSKPGPEEMHRYK